MSTSVEHGATAEVLVGPPQRAAGSPTKAHRLVVRDVSKRWGGAPEPVLDSLELTLESHAVVSIVGPNGTGKTTLLRILAGLIAPDRGTVHLDGLTPVSDRRDYQARIGFLTAGQTGLYARFSVRAHLEYWARVAFVPRRERRGAVEGALRRFELGPLATQRADRLSTGQRQRLRLAMTFLHDPALVLLDEPHTSLDPAGLAVLCDAVTSVADAGGTTVWCAPTAAEVEIPVSATFVLADGRVTPL